MGLDATCRACQSGPEETETSLPLNVVASWLHVLAFEILFPYPLTMAWFCSLD